MPAQPRALGREWLGSARRGDRKQCLVIITLFTDGLTCHGHPFVPRAPQKEVVFMA